MEEEEEKMLPLSRFAASVAQQQTSPELQESPGSPVLLTRYGNLHLNT